MGFIAPTMTIHGPRDVSLVGADPETPGMTDTPALPGAGPDVPVLRYRRGRKPAYEQFGTIATEAGVTGSIEVSEADGSPDVSGVTRIEVTSKFKVTDDTGGQVTVDEAGHWEPVVLDGEIVTLDNDIVMAWVPD